MNARENTVQDARQETPGHRAHGPRPQASTPRGWARRATLLATLMLALAACDLLFDYPKRIQEIPEPWQKLDPGKPPEKRLKIEVVKEGGGSDRGGGPRAGAPKRVQNRWNDAI